MQIFLYFSHSIAFFPLFSILTSAGGLHKFPVLKDDFEQQLLSGCDSPYLLSFLVDFYEDYLEKNGKHEKYAGRAVEVYFCHLLHL